MSRGRSIFEDVMRLPWPLGAGIAALCVVALHAYLWWLADTAALTPFAQVIRQFVQWFGYGFAFLFMLCAFFSFLTQVLRGKRFDATRFIAEIRGLTWRQFETFIGEYFRRQGYLVVETPEGPDNGVDLVLRKDGEKTYVQCKHWKAKHVGVEKVRELLGSMTAGGAQNGILVASGNYTQPAATFALECGIRLIDGAELAALLDDAAAEPVLKPDASDLPAGVLCPVCAAPMVKRIAKRGPNQGGSFWGCSKYPQCRGIRQA
jgi:restriction system protein